MKTSQLYQQLTAFLFLAAFLAQSFSRTFVIADYYTNTSMYAKSCVNKARPKMNCRGKCQVMKKLQQEEKKDQENPGRKLENKAENYPVTASFYNTVSTYRMVLIKSNKLIPVSDGHSTDRSLDIFHPPQA